jgi:hypothetical protein
MSALCEEYGVSRRVGYKLLARYADVFPPPSEMDLEGHRPCPSPWTEAVYFLDLAARASKKVEHWRARLCGKQRKSTASVQGEG